MLFQLEGTRFWYIPLDADDEDQLRLGRDVELAGLLGDTAQADLLALCIAVLLDVLLSTLEDDATLLLVGLFEGWSALVSCSKPLTCQVLLHRSDPKDSIFADIIDRSLVTAWIRNIITSRSLFGRGPITDLLLLVDLGGALSTSLLLRLALLEQSLGDQDLVVGGDGAIHQFRSVRSPAYRSMKESAGGELLRVRHSLHG